MSASNHFEECKTAPTISKRLEDLKSVSLWDMGCRPVWLRGVVHQPFIKRHPAISQPIFMSIGKRFSFAAQLPQSHLDFLLWLTVLGHTVTTQGKWSPGEATNGELPIQPENRHPVTARLEFRDRPVSAAIPLETLFPDLPVSGSAVPHALNPADLASVAPLEAQKQAWEFAVAEALRLYDEREFSGTLEEFGKTRHLHRTAYKDTLEGYLWWMELERAAYFGQI